MVTCEFKKINFVGMVSWWSSHVRKIVFQEHGHNPFLGKTLTIWRECTLESSKERQKL